MITFRLVLIKPYDSFTEQLITSPIFRSASHSPRSVPQLKFNKKFEITMNVNCAQKTTVNNKISY